MKVCELLSDETKWTKGAFARDVKGVECSPNTWVAQSWCLLGAISKCYGYVPISDGFSPTPCENAIRQLRNALRRVHGRNVITDWQDDPETTFEMVQELLKEANI